MFEPGLISMMPLYKEKFAVGTMVRVADRPSLENFKRTWKYHHPIDLSQFAHADALAKVESVGFYHGGDVLYRLDGIPGIWHEECLRAV
jgi:hypothetical protein